MRAPHHIQTHAWTVATRATCGRRCSIFDGSTVTDDKRSNRLPIRAGEVAVFEKPCRGVVVRRQFLARLLERFG